LEHAEEAFSSVLRMDKDFDKADEIFFRLGIIYKQQQKYEEALKVCGVISACRASLTCRSASNGFIATHLLL
jgi:hypothetical protein